MSQSPPNAPPLPASMLNARTDNSSKNDQVKPPAAAAKKTPCEDLHEVHPQLYVGCLEAACNVDLLNTLGIKHVLTVEDHPLDDAVQAKLASYKFIRLFDLPFSNILEILDECFEYIDQGVNQGHAVLVHW